LRTGCDAVSDSDVPAHGPARTPDAGEFWFVDEGLQASGSAVGKASVGQDSAS
jgi:hypothetical protein